MPESATLELPRLVVKLSVPVSALLVLGVKVTFHDTLLPAAIGRVLPLARVAVKSRVAVTATLSSDRPVLLNETDCAAEVTFLR